MADAGLPLTVIRPSWLFGERDRTTVPRLIREFRRGRMMIVGKGDNPLSAVYAGVVADAAILAAPIRARGARRTTSPARAGSRSASFSTCLPMRFRCRPGHPARPVRARVHGRLSPRDSGPAAHAVAAPARDALRSLVAGAPPGIQHRESPCPVGLGTVQSATSRASSGTVRWFQDQESERLPRRPG